MSFTFNPPHTSKIIQPFAITKAASVSWTQPDAIHWCDGSQEEF